jgi:hypothetical protein
MVQLYHLRLLFVLVRQISPEAIMEVVQSWIVDCIDGDYTRVTVVKRS